MRSDERGFSLLEALVAVAILSGGLIAALDLQSVNARRDAAIFARNQALFAAEGLIAEVASGVRKRGQDASGVMPSGVAWRIEFSAYGAPPARDATSRLWRVTATTSPRGGGVGVTLSTLIHADGAT